MGSLLEKADAPSHPGLCKEATRPSALLVHGTLHVVDHGEAADGLQEVAVRPVQTAGPGGTVLPCRPPHAQPGTCL